MNEEMSDRRGWVVKKLGAEGGVLICICLMAIGREVRQAWLPTDTIEGSCAAVHRCSCGFLEIAMRNAANKSDGLFEGEIATRQPWNGNHTSRRGEYYWRLDG
jgi:hypothetical protein